MKEGKNELRMGLEGRCEVRSLSALRRVTPGEGQFLHQCTENPAFRIVPACKGHRLKHSNSIL